MVKRYKIKSSLDWVSACALALFYMEVKRHKRKKPKWTDPKRKACIFYLFEAVSGKDYARGKFSGIEQFQGLCVESCKERGWQTIDCAIDSMDVGYTGNMPWETRSDILNTIRDILEKDFGIPVTRILALVHEE